MFGFKRRLRAFLAWFKPKPEPTVRDDVEAYNDRENKLWKLTQLRQLRANAWVLAAQAKKRKKRSSDHVALAQHYTTAILRLELEIANGSATR